MVLKRAAADIARRFNALDIVLPMPVHAMLEFHHKDKLKDWLMSNSNCGRTQHREQNIILKKKEEIIMMIDKRRLIASLRRRWWWSC